MTQLHVIFKSLADTDTIDTHIQPLTSFHLANSTPYRDFTLCPVSQGIDKKHRLYFSPRVTDTARQTQLLGRSHSKSWNDSTDCFNGTYSIVCMPLGVVDCISLAACQPAGHRWHPHLDVSTQASWRQASFPRLSAVSAKLQGSCFFCSSIFWLRQCCEKGGAERWIRRATERGVVGERKKTKTSERTRACFVRLAINAQNTPHPNPR